MGRLFQWRVMMAWARVDVTEVARNHGQITDVLGDRNDGFCW